MANIDAPRGFKPVRYQSGKPFTGAATPYRLPSGYATALFPGDVVVLLSTGYIGIATAGATNQIRGVVAAINWTEATGQPTTRRYWPASTVTLGAQDAEIMVYDDPDLIFEAQFTNSTSAPATTDIGNCFTTKVNAGNTANGLSAHGVDYTTATTTANNGQWRFMEFVKRGDNDPTSAYARVQVMPNLHDLRVNSGV